MIVVKVELHSAVTGKVSEIARAVIYNEGTFGLDNAHGDYTTFSVRGRDAETLEKNMRKGLKVAVRKGRIENYARLSQHVWNLVAKALTAMGYGK